VVIAATRCTRRSKSQHDIAQDSSEAQERAADDFTCRTRVIIGAGVGRFGSTASTGGDSRAGGLGSREGGRNNRGSDGDGNGGSAFFSLVIDPGDERSQVGVLHVVGEDELFDSRNWAREVFRRGEVIALGIYYDGIPVVVLGGEARKIDRVHALTCVVQNQREEQVRRIR
jgi:hypothetical protein